MKNMSFDINQNLQSFEGKNQYISIMSVFDLENIA